MDWRLPNMPVVAAVAIAIDAAPGKPGHLTTPTFTPDGRSGVR